MSPERVYAVIIGIESYSFSDPPYSLRGLKYAENDAREIRQCITETFNIEEANIRLLINSDATKRWMQNELPHFIKGLTKQDTFIFYYAGHGYHSDNGNRIATWETTADSLESTTVSLREVLLDPLKESKCRKTLVFLDASSKIINSVHRRGKISDLQKSEFDLINSNMDSAFFIASSPGQSSYQSEELKHGIWTHYLLEALRGNAPAAFIKEEWLTDRTLQNYLSLSVPKFIRENTKIRGNQEPYAVINDRKPFEIARIQKNEFALKELSLDFKNSFLRKEVIGSISSISGFARKRGHFIPERHSGRAGEFVERLLNDDILSESKEIYNNAKSILHLKRREINRSTFEGGANVDCDIFRLALSCQQNPSEPSEYILTRTVSLRVSVDGLPDDFDNIFPVSPNLFIVPITEALDFDEIADLFEGLSDKWNGRFSEDEDNQSVSIHTNAGISFTVDLEKREFIIQTYSDRGCLQLLQTVSNELKRLTGNSANNLLTD